MTSTEPNKRLPITIQRWEPGTRGKIRLKIAEHIPDLATIRHNGKDYVVVSRYGRGRYQVKEVQVNVPGSN